MTDLEYDFGLVGLGVMGRNFILNIADHGFSAYGLDTNDEMISALHSEGVGKKVQGTTDKSKFIAALTTPRKIMMLVPAGSAVDSVIDDLLPLLDKGDLIIDGGNTFFTDTDRRAKYLEEKEMHFIGSGISGGSMGARLGPSLMPGGSKEAYELIQPIFEAAAAKVDQEPCVAYIGPGSAGNYVKMIHNGIEYGLMQLISEIYDLMKRNLGLDNSQIRHAFDSWNQGSLHSFLIEITAEIFSQKDSQSGNDLVDMILDKAKQKGTGKWTSQNAMDLGVAIPTIDMAVSMRALSAQKEARVKAQERYPLPKAAIQDLSVEDLEQALFFAFVITYSQGMSLLTAASQEYGYHLDLESISKIWRGGCIIRAALLEDMRIAYEKDPLLSNLLMDPGFAQKVDQTVGSCRKAVQAAIQSTIPVSCLASTLNYFDAFRTGRLPLNLIQAQRDHFGSHTYERTDQPGIFHTDWS